jgi:DNA-directed RNA polymerase subunit K/omega
MQSKEEATLHSFVMSLDNDDITQIYKNYNPENNKSSNIMTKYEKTLIIGQRAEQIANGAEPLIDVPDGIYDIVEIARLELNMKASPFIIKRRYGNAYEYYKIEDLEIK